MGQDSIYIKGQLLNNSRYAKIVIEKFGIGFESILAVAVAPNSGEFSIAAPLSIEPGVYRFRYSQSTREFVDVIINGKEKHIAFTLDVMEDEPFRVPIFQQSEANILWYSWRSTEQKALLEIALLDKLLAEWPNSYDDFYNASTKERSHRVAVYQQKRENFINDSENDFWAVAMIKNQPVFFGNPGEDWRIQEFKKRNQYWSNVSTTDPLLINTPLYTERILDYLMYYMNPEMQFSEEEMTQGFKKSVDTLVNRFSANETTKDFIVRYLRKGFSEIDMIEVVHYIDDSFPRETHNIEESLLKPISEGENIRIGSLAPEVIVMSRDGQEKTLKDFTQEKILLVFWASWCPHCLEVMPKVQQWAENHVNTLVLAISLDDDYTTFQQEIKKFPNLLHYCDLQKWEGAIAKDFQIAATPTFLLLNEERRIVLEEGNFSDLEGVY